MEVIYCVDACTVLNCRVEVSRVFSDLELKSEGSPGCHLLSGSLRPAGHIVEFPYQLNW